MAEIAHLFDHPLDKNILYQHFFRTLYNNASKVILLKGLPDDADKEFIMSQLLLVGRIAVFKTKGKTYFLNGHIGGIPDEYYYPTKVLIANPVLGSFDLERDKEAVMVYLTPTDRILDVPKSPTIIYGGLFSLISMVANILAECMTTVNTTLMNTRVHAIYTADTESAAKSAEPILKSIYMGKPYSVVTSELLERLNVNPLSEHGLSNCLIETLEVCQYVLSLFWNGIGIDANYNMKRERLITAEVDKNIQSLIVPIQTILETLNDGFKKANNLFDIEVEAIKNPDFALEQEKENNNGISASITSSSNDVGDNDGESITNNLSSDESRDNISGHRLDNDNVEKTDDEESSSEENCSKATPESVTIIINNNNGDDNNNTNEVKGDDDNEKQSDDGESDKNELENQDDKPESSSADTKTERDDD